MQVALETPSPLTTLMGSMSFSIILEMSSVTSACVASDTPSLGIVSGCLFLMWYIMLVVLLLYFSLVSHMVAVDLVVHFDENVPHGAPLQALPLPVVPLVDVRGRVGRHDVDLHEVLVVGGALLLAAALDAADHRLLVLVQRRGVRMVPAHVVHHGAGGSAAVLQRRVAFHAADEVAHLFEAVPHRAASPAGPLHVPSRCGTRSPGMFPIAS